MSDIGIYTNLWKTQTEIKNAGADNNLNQL